MKCQNKYEHPQLANKDGTPNIIECGTEMEDVGQVIVSTEEARDLYQCPNCKTIKLI